MSNINYEVIMSNPNTIENFKDAFIAANAQKDNPYKGITYSAIFRNMSGENSFPSPDYVREQIQAGINQGSIKVGYGVLDSAGHVESCFSGLENEPELTSGQTVEPVYYAGPEFYSE